MNELGFSKNPNCHFGDHDYEKNLSDKLGTCIHCGAPMPYSQQAANTFLTAIGRNPGKTLVWNTQNQEWIVLEENYEDS